MASGHDVLLFVLQSHPGSGACLSLVLKFQPSFLVPTPSICCNLQIVYKDDLTWPKGIGCYVWDTPEILHAKHAYDLRNDVSLPCFWGFGSFKYASFPVWSRVKGRGRQIQTLSHATVSEVVMRMAELEEDAEEQSGHFSGMQTMQMSCPIVLWYRRDPWFFLPRYE